MMYVKRPTVDVRSTWACCKYRLSHESLLIVRTTYSVQNSTQRTIELLPVVLESDLV